MPILNDAAKTPKGGIGARPFLKARADGSNDIVECGEVLIVQATAADQLPHPFDGIEFGAVRRKEVQAEPILDACSPGRVQSGVMITGVVTDDDHALAIPATEA